MEKREQVQEKFINIFSKSFWGIALCSVRVGKTRVLLKSIQKHSKNYIKDPKILVLYPFVDIQKSWSDECDKLDYHPNITYCTFKSIEKVVDENWDYICVDEFHLIGEENQLPLLGKLAWRHSNIILASGTCSNDTLEAVMGHTGLGLVINYPVEDAIGDGIICDFNIIIYEYELDKLNTVTYGKVKKWDSTELKECNRLSRKVDTTYGQEKMFHALARMRFINSCWSLQKTVKKWLLENSEKRLILFTGDENVGKNYYLPMYNSKSKDDSVLKAFQDGIINQICLIKKGKQGITYPNLDTILLTAIDSNSENLEQAIGRSLLLDTDTANVHIFVSNQEFQRKWLNKALTNIKPEKIQWLKN